MSYIIGQPKAVVVEYAGEKIIFEIKDPSSEEVVGYLNNRMPVVAGVVTQNYAGAAVEFADKILLDCSGLQYLDKGKVKDLNNKVPDWLSLIPAHMKRAIAQKFDETKADLVQEAKPT